MLANRRPLGENARPPSNLPYRPLDVCHSTLPEAISHRPTVPRRPPEARSFPSGEKAAARNKPFFPRLSLPALARVAAFQSQTASRSQQARSFLSGDRNVVKL